MKTLITAIVLRALGAASSVPYPTVHELKDSVSTPAPGNPGAKRWAPKQLDRKTSHRFLIPPGIQELLLQCSRPFTAPAYLSKIQRSQVLQWLLACTSCNSNAKHWYRKCVPTRCTPGDHLKTRVLSSRGLQWLHLLSHIVGQQKESCPTIFLTFLQCDGEARGSWTSALWFHKL